jgi:alpha-soluble NSF attachment protein
MNAADIYFQKAEKKTKKGSWWEIFSSFSKEQRDEEAAELFEKAGNLYKIAKDWDKAALSFYRGSQCYKKEPYRAATFLLTPSKCYVKNDVEKAISSLKEASDIFLNDGKYIQSAKCLQQIAEHHENRLDTNLAIDMYLASAKLYDDENDYQAVNCLW